MEYDPSLTLRSSLLLFFFVFSRAFILLEVVIFAVVAVCLTDDAAGWCSDGFGGELLYSHGRFNLGRVKTVLPVFAFLHVPLQEDDELKIGIVSADFPPLRCCLP